MARKLNKKQIELLNENDIALEFSELPFRVKSKLIDLNDYETLISDVDRYLYDRHIKNIFG